MLVDSLELLEGSHIQNLTIQVSSGFPSSPSVGELVHILNDGPYYYTGTEWQKVPTGEQPAPTFQKTLSMPGTLIVMNGTSRWYPHKNISITKIIASFGTAPVGGGVDIRIKKNNVSSQSIFATSNYQSVDVSIALTTSDYITVDIAQIGSTTAGADLSLAFTYS